MLGLMVTALALGAMELGLRLWVDQSPPRLISPLAFQRADAPITAAGTTPESVIFGGPNIVAIEKPAGLRLFFFGGSATEGFHMTAHSSFVGWTQRFLRALMPQTPVEIINLGAGGEGSRQVADLVSATANSQQADLFIVYSGNNEYYELRALKAAIPGFDARTELARRRLSVSHLYRFLRTWIRPKAAAVDPGLKLRSVDDIGVEIDADERALGVLLYGEHIEAIIDAAQKSGVPLMLSTVADQARSFAFHGSPPPLSDGVAALVARLDQVGRLRDETAVQAILLALGPKLKSQADHFAVARLLDRDQRWAAAREHYAQAEYLDPRPRRSNAPMRALLKQVASAKSVAVCDAASMLAAASRGGITGEDVFIDPCHPNPLGHRRLAEIFVRCIVEHKLIDGLSPSEIELDAMFNATPLAGENPYRLDHFTERRAQLHDNRAMSDDEIAQTIRAFDDGSAEGAAQAGHHAVLFELHRGALAWYDLSIRRGGDLGALQLSRGLTLQRLNQLNQAREALSEAVSIMGGDVDATQAAMVLGARFDTLKQTP